MKSLLASILAVFAACALTAQEPVKASAEAAKPASSGDWDFVGVAFFPDAPPSANVTDVYGLKLGIPVSFGEKNKVVGAECGLFAATTKQVKGFQGALLWCKADKVSGLQANPIVNISKDVSGVQAGLVNVADDTSFQLGLINYIKNSSVPFFPLVNFKF